LFVILLGFSTFCCAQSSHRVAKSAIKPLTATDRRNYVITIDQNKVSTLKYSRPKDNYYEKTVLFVPVKLTNNSNDTLKYMTMSCSWEEFYMADRREIATIPIEPCDKNIPKCLTLGPHKSVIVNVPVVKLQRGKRFRIGMALIKLNNHDNLFDLLNIGSYSIDKKDDNIIWSNTIELP